MADTQDKQKPPECTRVVTLDSGSRTKCTRPAYWRNIHGTFGLKAELLCDNCVAELKQRGWKIRYMLEGDDPERNHEGEIAQ